MSLTARWMGHRSSLMLSRSSRRRCAKAISPSWVSCAPTGSAALAGPQSDRNGILEAEDSAAQGCRSHRDNADEADRQAHQDICTRAVRELLSTCRIRVVTHIKWEVL